MPRNTSNKSLRTERSLKELRLTSLSGNEVAEGNRAAGASGAPSKRRKRPGRAASLLTSNARKRSERWRSVAKGKLRREPEPVRKAAAIRAEAKKNR